MDQKSIDVLIKTMFVSVIIPAHNAAAWISESLDSVLRQTYVHWEIIVVDDGSTDNTGKIVESYCARDDRIRLLTQTINRGPATARNIGMLAARGDYLAFLDADDLWLTTKLEKQVASLQTKRDVGACYTWFETVNDHRQVIQQWKDLRRTFWHNPVDAFALARGNYVCGSASSVMIRRTLIETVGLFDESMRGSEDLDYWYRIALHTSFCLVPEALVQIRRRSKTRSLATERNLLGSLDFIRNARRCAPGAHVKMLREFEIETKCMLWVYNIVSSRRVFRRARFVDFLLYGKQSQLIKRCFRSVMSLNGRNGQTARGK